MSATVTSDPLRVVILTEGDPARTSGGSLYHRELADRAAEHGVVVTFVSVPPRRYPLAMVDAPRVLRSASALADVLVVDSLASNTMGPWLAVRRQRPPMIGSVHQIIGGSDTGPWRRAWQRVSDRLTWSAMQHLVVPSALLADTLADDGIPDRDMTVVAPGSDLSAWHGAPPQLREGRAAAVLCVANWLPRKGVLELLDAVARVPEGLITLHLVGDTRADAGYAHRVRRRIAEPDLAGRVVCHGAIAHDAVSRLYAGADMFVMVSVEEPYGIVYGEAMRAGLPIVGWAAGNLPNLVDDGVEGRTLAPGDIDGLAKVLAELAVEPAARRAMGAAACARAAGLPSWADTAARFFAVCRAAIAGECPNAAPPPSGVLAGSTRGK